MLSLLFVYGTLHPDRAPRELADLVARFELLSPATVHGRLYDFGRYPALIVLSHDDPTATVVPGYLFRIPTDPATFTRLDDYEGFHPTDPAASLFLRREITVTLPDGTSQTAWAYTY
ncbi:MAG: gamma-glutamylcyclotransferase family protein, partial [Acidobacteriota bacterium]